MIVTVVFVATALLYALSAGLFVTFLARGNASISRSAALVLVGAVLGHIGFLGLNWTRFGIHPFADIHQALAVMSLVVITAFLVTTRWRSRLSVLGAFIAPVTLLLFMGAAFRGSVGPVPEGLQSAMLPVHIGVNVLGLAAFAIAFAAASAYLIQERQLRRKQLGGLFQRLPALDVLDTFGLRAVLVGFPLLTLGVVTGTMFAIQLTPGEFRISAAQGFGLLAWLLFAAVLLLRVAAGWQGRRAAIGTMMGFFLTMVVLAGYVMRGSVEAV